MPTSFIDPALSYDSNYCIVTYSASNSLPGHAALLVESYTAGDPKPYCFSRYELLVCQSVLVNGARKFGVGVAEHRYTEKEYALAVDPPSDRPVMALRCPSQLKAHYRKRYNRSKRVAKFRVDQVVEMIKKEKVLNVAYHEEREKCCKLLGYIHVLSLEPADQDRIGWEASRSSAEKEDAYIIQLGEKLMGKDILVEWQYIMNKLTEWTKDNNYDPTYGMVQLKRASVVGDSLNCALWVDKYAIPLGLEVGIPVFSGGSVPVVAAHPQSGKGAWKNFAIAGGLLALSVLTVSIVRRRWSGSGADTSEGSPTMRF